MASVGFLLVVAGDGDAAGAPQAILDIYQERASAEAEGEGSDEILLNGTVSVLVPWSPEQQVVEVTMEVLNEKLNWVFDPPKLVFEKSGERIQHFDLKLSVPHDYPAGENNVEIGGRWRYKPGITGGTIESDNIILTMAPFEDGRIGAPYNVEIEEGVERVIPVVVENPGNVDEDYYIEMEGVDTLRNIGIQISMEGDGIIEVDFGKDADLSITMIGDDIEGGRTFHLTLKLLDMDSDVEYDSTTVSIETFERNVPQPKPIDDRNGDDDDEPGDEDDEPVDDDESGPPGVNTSSSGPSGALIGYIAVVLVLGAAAVAGFIIYSRRKD
jgi:hypothetical protein